MSVSREWEAIYERGGQAIRWPWSDVVSLVTRYASSIAPGARVLELGCGSGANIPFFKAAQCDYHSVEGSATVLERVWLAHPDLRMQIVLGDFTNELPVPGTFDLIVDRAALSNNDEAAIRRSLALVHDRLRPAGIFVTVDWPSTRHGDALRGHSVVGLRTRTGIEDGPLEGVGLVHFADEASLLDLFRDFEILMLEHKLLEAHVPAGGNSVATWNLVARKRR